MIESSNKDVALAATPEPLVAAVTMVQYVMVRGKKDNTGTFAVGSTGNTAAAGAFNKNESVGWGGEIQPDGSVMPFDLQSVEVRVSVDTDGVDFWYEPVAR